MSDGETFNLTEDSLLPRAEERWTELCRLTAEDAQSRAPAGTGRLRESMEWSVSREGDRITGEITFSAPHAVYVHEGTGRYHPSGRHTPWVYAVEEDGETRFFTTEGQPAVPFLREAVEAAEGRLRGGDY